MVLALAAALGTAACGGDGDEIAATGDDRADQARAAAVDAGLDDEVADFLALLARGETATYRVRFPGPAEGTELEVSSRPPDRRVEVSTDGEVTDVRLVTGGQAFACSPTTEDGEGAFTCERTDSLVEPPGVFREGVLDDLRSALAERTEDYSFEVEVQEVADVDARCLVTRLRGGRESPELGASGTICASPEGAILLVDQGRERLEAVEYATDVDDGAFVRPDAAADGTDG